MTYNSVHGDLPTKIAFVIEPGKLEEQAIQLCSSIRNVYGNSIEVVACHPSDADEISNQTRKVLKNYQVQIVRSRPFLNGKYRIGNKFDAVRCLEGGEGVGLFLDTDVMAVNCARFVKDKQLSAASATHKHFSDEQWELLYLNVVSKGFHRWNKNQDSGVSYPYFNSGVLAIERALASRFAEAWSTASEMVLHSCIHFEDWQNRYLDQCSLPLAAAGLNLPITQLEQAYNFPGWISTLPTSEVVYFYHYQNSRRLREFLSSY